MPVMSDTVSDWASALRAITSAIWSRQERKSLFDLAQSKPWSERAYNDAATVAAQWLVRELSLDGRAIDPAPAPTLSIDAARRLAGLSPSDDSRDFPAVSREVRALAPLVSARANTLANQLTFPRTNLRPIRWARLLARLADEELPLDAWLYHRRTPTTVARQVLSWNDRADFDVGDELLLLSLLSLWQRRRRTDEVRSNRRTTAARSSTPKPIASLTTALIEPSQRRALITFAAQLDVPRRRSLLLFVVEVVLTAAHGCSFVARRRGARRSPHEALAWVEPIVERFADGRDGERETLLFRVATQRAFHNRLIVASRDVSDEYVRASLCAARHKAGVDGECEESFEVDAPGVCMLLPQLRQKGRIRR